MAAAIGIDPSRKRDTSPSPYMKSGTLCELVPANKLPKKPKRKLQERNPEQQDNSTEPVTCGKLKKVSEALGLRSDFLDDVKSVPKEILWHRSLVGFIPIFIERKFFDIKEQPLKEKLSKELLKAVGFTKPEVIDTIIERSLKMGQHLDPLDFIKRFVKDELKYNPALVEHPPEDDNTGVVDFAAYRHDEQNEDREVIRLFHGTDRSSADDIKKNGIWLDFGRHKHDFSDGGGFYLTTSFEHAKTWARSQTRRPVVLELKIPKNCIEKARTLVLDVTTEEGRSEWDEVVREHRSGRPCKDLNKKNMREYDCIQGPISVPSQDRNCDETSRVPEVGSLQLCIVKQSFAKVIQNTELTYTLYTEPKERK